MKLTVFGDVMWNHALRLHSSLPIECNERALGGTLINTSSGARQYFDEVLAIGAVGEQDRRAVEDHLTQIGVETNVRPVPGMNTGVCILQYDNEMRTSILSLRQANMHLTPDAIDMCSVLSSDFIFVNGWSCLPESTTSKTLLQVLAAADAESVPIIFDVLPHHIQRSEMTGDFLRVLAMSRVVIYETLPQDQNSSRVFDASVLSEIARQCRLFILFDWVRSVRVESGSRVCLSEEPTNYGDYSKEAVGSYLDGMALRQVVTYYR